MASTREQQPEVTSEDINRLLDLLEVHPNGMNKAMLIEQFNTPKDGRKDDRAARRVVSYIVTEGIAALAYVTTPVFPNGCLKLLTPEWDKDLARQEVRQLVSRAEKIQARAKGFEEAFKRGTVKRPTRQESLF